MFTFDDDFDNKKNFEEETATRGTSLFEEETSPLVEEEHEEREEVFHKKASQEKERKKEPDYSDLDINEDEEYIIRMSKNERIQHLSLFICVTTLVITGFALKIPIDYITKLGRVGAGLFQVRGIIHRIAGTVLLCTTAYHFLNMALSKDGRLYFQRMLPRIKDVTDGIHNISYMIGFAKVPPKMEWFDYKEKIEYWALQAGTFLIGTTGVLLWSHRKWPKLVVDLSYLIHGMEAILATGAIIIWHFYYIHFKPGQFPMNRTWIDGKMSLSHLKHEHRLVYDRYMAERAKEIRG